MVEGMVERMGSKRAPESTAILMFPHSLWTWPGGNVAQIRYAVLSHWHTYK